MIHDLLLYGGGTSLGLLLVFLPYFWNRIPRGKH